MHRANVKNFLNPKTIQLFNRYATYNGSNPFQTPATLNVIPHLEYNIGAFFPEKGMYNIVESLYQLAIDLEVKFIFNTSAEQIITDKTQLKGLKIKGFNEDEDLIPAEIIITNADINLTYKKLLPQINPPHKILNQEKSSSALIFYWGINKTFSQLGLHNIFFTENYQLEFEKIFKEKIIPTDPTIYINITSKIKTDDAPYNCENWFVMINTPNNIGQDWDIMIKKARENILQKLSRLLNEDISNLILCEEMLDPRAIESKTGSFLGALYGNSSNNKYAAFLRHANFSNKIKGLYFAGGSVHPGGGIPLALYSAKIATDLIK